MTYFCIKYENTSNILVQSQKNIPYQTLPTTFLISLLPFSCLCYLASPWYGQKIVSGKSETIAYNAVIYAAIFLFFLYGAGVWCSKILSDKGVSVNQSSDILGFVMSHVLPHGVKGFGLAIVLFISITTLASAWNVMTALIMGDKN